jgi:hypothetical protein
MVQNLGRSASVAGLFLLRSLAAFAQVPSSQHVVLVIDENTSYGNVMANMLWLVAEGNANGYATGYTSHTSGSLIRLRGQRERGICPRKIPRKAKTAPIKPAESSRKTVKIVGSLLPMISCQMVSSGSLLKRSSRYEMRHE